MRVLTRFRRTELPPAWLEEPSTPGSILLQRLGEEGYSVRDPDTDSPLDDASLRDRGVMLVDLTAIAERRDSQRCRVSRPGQPLTLVPEGRRVAVHDGAGFLDIGYVEDASAPAIAQALQSGIELQAVAVWETRALDGTRTGLQVLIAPEDTELIFSLDAPTTFAG